MSSAKWRPFCLGLNVLTKYYYSVPNETICRKQKQMCTARLEQVIQDHVHYDDCHNGRDSVSNHQPYDCLLNHLFRRWSKKTSKLRIPGLCVGTGEFPAQMASNAENVSIWWCYHGVAL